MHISFIGMSNIGKTFWARRLVAEQPVENINCDTLIEHKLGPELTQLGYRGLRDVAKWMGQPPDAQYEDNSAAYVAWEKKVMRDVIERVQAPPPAVIDTTGSVIHAGDDIIAALRKLTRVVYFAASDAHIDSLFRRYITTPKPLIWGNAFKPRPGETPTESLRRCYPDLLHERVKHYQAMAHVTIPYERHRNHTGTATAMLKEVGIL